MFCRYMFADYQVIYYFVLDNYFSKITIDNVAYLINCGLVNETQEIDVKNGNRFELRVQNLKEELLLNYSGIEIADSYIELTTKHDIAVYLNVFVRVYDVKVVDKENANLKF